MKTYLTVALLAMFAFAFGAPDANAGRCYGPSCGESRDGPYHPRHHYPEVFHTYVAINVFVSDRPAPGFGTDIQIRAGSPIEVSCDQYDWCRVLSPRFRNLFVPKYCLARYRPRWRSHHYGHPYKHGGRGYREYGGGAYEGRRYDDYENGNGPRYNGNGYNGGY